MRDFISGDGEDPQSQPSTHKSLLPLPLSALKKWTTNCNFYSNHLIRAADNHCFSNQFNNRIKNWKILQIFHLITKAFLYNLRKAFKVLINKQITFFQKKTFYWTKCSNSIPLVNPWTFVKYAKINPPNILKVQHFQLHSSIQCRADLLIISQLIIR